MPRPLLLGASELEVVPSCRDVRGVVGASGFERLCCDTQSRPFARILRSVIDDVCVGAEVVF